jgi:lysophospholipase L1-like esterase
VLHLGDSMVAGSGVDGQFTADLNRMEPEIEHINSGIGATAPDSYLALLWTWLSLHPPDLVVMHLTSNDLQELDQPYPCADWQPLLTYDGETRLRFAQAHLSNINRQRLRWLIHNSPPPYLLRLAVGFSHTAALAAAAFVRLGHRLGYSLPETDEDSHRPQLAAILRAARDELHRGGIPFVVNILPWRPRLEAHAPADETWVETKMKRIALSLGVDVLDASPEFEAATGRGEQLFTNAGGPLDIHFNAAGHALMASFLHQQLRR